jgi:hypothetical protein
MAEKKISYTVRDFQGVRTELVNYVKTYYPELIQNFNDASVFSVLMDLNAAVADNLNFQIDRSIQETVLQYAQQKTSLFNIARTYGLKIPGQRPSISLVDFSITVPAFGDKEDIRYCGILRRGTQVNGAGQSFETVYDIDFSSQYNGEGQPNSRIVRPNVDANGTIINYTVTKREVVLNGLTKVFKRVITPNDVRPFFELFLPERNVLGVTSVIVKDGSQYSNVPSDQEFLSPNGRWYEVRALVDDRVFVEDPTKPSDAPGIKIGRYISTSDKFITEYTPQGFLKLTFGGGNNSAEDQLREFARNGQSININKYVNNLGLGNTLKSNSTLFIQYRVGGGVASNVGIGVITQVQRSNFFVNGPSENINTSVVNSLSCTNPIAAVGGAGAPTLEEIRNFVSFNFSAQNRAVTVNDYDSILRNMPSQFGAPSKVSIVEENNKIKIKLLSYDSNGTLTSIVPNALKTNIANYLSNYRMINDYVSVESANVIDLGFDISVVLDSSQSQGSIIAKIVDIVSTYMSPTSRQLGQNVNVSELRRQIQTENGVLSISDIQVFNKVGGQYSSSQTSQPYSNQATKQIELISDTIFAEPTQIYQVRFPNKDIRVSVVNLSTVTFS